MKLKRLKVLLIVFVLACMTVAPALAGCSGGETDVQTKQAADVTTDEGQTEQTADVAGNEGQTEQADDEEQMKQDSDVTSEEDQTEQSGDTAADEDQTEQAYDAEAEEAQTEQTGTWTAKDNQEADADDEGTVSDTFKSVADSDDTSENEGGILKKVLIAVISFAVGFAAALIIALLLIRPSQRKKDAASDAVEKRDDGNMSGYKTTPASAGVLPDAENGTIGKVHHVGCRRNQQDTVGFTNAGNGLLAIVSDGMGGLSDGEKVSQQAVMGMFQAAERVTQVTADNPLYEMLAGTNSQILNMLGPDGIYKSGATLLAVYTDGCKYHWIAVGDSRIYFYCDHHLLQVNSEHVYKRQLIRKAVNKKISFATVKNDPQRDRLVSFLGMGDLEEIDGSLRPAELLHGDKLLLMSDGVFNAISEKTMLKVLESTKNASEAAALMEKQVLAAGNPKQDNFTCLILDF